MDCEVCHAEVPEDDLLLLEGRRVCMACKPLAVQQLKEGCLPSMPSEPIEVSDHELTFPELVRKAWLICCRDWPALFALKVLAALPSIVRLVFSPPTKLVHVRHASVFSLAWFLESLVTALSVLGVAWVVSERVQGRSFSFGQALDKAVRRWLPAIGTILLMGVVVGFLTLLLIVPGIMFLVYYSFTDYVVALRNVAGTGALEYSKNLVEGRWWRVAGKLFGLGLPALTLVTCLAMVMRYLPQEWYVNVPYTLSVHVLYAFSQVGGTLLFLNLDTLRQKLPVNRAEQDPH